MGVAAWAEESEFEIVTAVALYRFVELTKGSSVVFVLSNTFIEGYGESFEPIYKVLTLRAAHPQLPNGLLVNLSSSCCPDHGLQQPNIAQSEYGNWLGSSPQNCDLVEHSEGVTLNSVPLDLRNIRLHSEGQRR